MNLLGAAAHLQGQGVPYEQAQQLMAERRQKEEAAKLQALDEQRKKALFSDNRLALGYLKNGDVESVKKLGANRIDNIRRLGGDPVHTEQLLQRIDGGESPESIMKDMQTLDDQAVAYGYLEAPAKAEPPNPENMNVQSSEILSDGTVVSVLKNGMTTVTDSSGKLLKGEERTKAIKKAREFGAMAQGDRAAQREIGKLEAQYKLTPKVKSAVEEAVLAARDKSAVGTEDRSNERAFEVYQAATNGLLKSFEDTTTGPFAGFLPAITSSQQIADGAVAAMAPTLKQLFRSAGEGTFTDSDQRILMQMIPTRSDRPDSVRAKLANIDAIVKAKLGISEQKEPQQTTPTPSPAPQESGVIDWGNM